MATRFETIDREFAGRVPPQANDVEMAVLGAMMRDAEAVGLVIEVLDDTDFYKPSHRKVFAAMQALFERSEPVDLATVASELEKSGDLDKCGGRAALVDIADSVFTAANAQAHARLVKDKAVLRQLITVTQNISEACFSAPGEVGDLLDEAEGRIFAISESRTRQDFTSISDLTVPTFDRIDQYYKRGGGITGLACGFTDLDNLTAGMHAGDLIVLAGRPSMGKTAFALNIMEYVSLVEKRACAIFSLEMSKDQLAERLLASVARVNGLDMRKGRLRREKYDDLYNAAGKLHEAQIWIDDSAALTVLELRAKARRLKAQHDIGLVVIDYMQMMHGPRNAENRQQEISIISRSLKSLAKELKIPVMALSQLSRQVEQRGGDRRPQLADLRECVTGDTLVCLSDGRRTPIRDLIGESPSVLTMAAGGKIARAHAAKVWLVGKRRVKSVKLASGRTIHATVDHRLYALSGWTRVSELTKGSRLATARFVPEADNALEWPEARLILLGHLVGDGSYLPHQPLRYTTGSEENSEAVAQAARDEFGVTVNRHPGRGNWHQLVFSGDGDRWNPMRLNKWLRDLGIFGQRSHQKHLPPEVFRLTNDQLALLLRHLWATDGTIYRRKAGTRGGHTISFTTNSQRLAFDVAALLLRLGIIARIVTVPRDRHRQWYQVCVSGSAQQLRFLDVVGAFGPRIPQAERLRRALEQTGPGTNVDTISREVFGRVRSSMAEQGISQRSTAALRGTSYGGTSHFRFAPPRETLASYAEILDDRSLLSLAESDLFWDEVTEITDAGEEEVYDLTVPETAAWLADGIISHNSGAIEQDADVVMFVYRPERYGITEEKGQSLENTAEIIVGKQRNGPTGTVFLTFLKECTRFENRADTRVVGQPPVTAPSYEAPPDDAPY